MDLFFVLWAVSGLGVVWTTHLLDPGAARRETWLLAAVPGVNSLLLLCALMLMVIQASHRRTGHAEK
jgi:hypothetical protein